MREPLNPKNSPLTITQRRIISLIASGMSFEEVANHMSRTRKHIYDQVLLARNRYAVATTSQLVAVCVNEGEIILKVLDRFITSDEAIGLITYS